MKGMWENVLAKEFFGSINIDRGQVGGPQMPLLGRRDDKETPNLGCRDMKWLIMRLVKVYKVASERSVDHKFLL